MLQNLIRLQKLDRSSPTPILFLLKVIPIANMQVVKRIICFTVLIKIQLATCIGNVYQFKFKTLNFHIKWGCSLTTMAVLCFDRGHPTPLIFTFVVKHILHWKIILKKNNLQYFLRGARSRLRYKVVSCAIIFLASVNKVRGALSAVLVFYHMYHMY